MSLENLVKIHQLHRQTTNLEEVQRLLAAAARNLADSRVTSISEESRFDLAYKAIMQCALVGLLAHGYRPSTTVPGHHQTMIQSLELTLGVSKAEWVVLDTLRKKRNSNDYLGDPIEPAALKACVERARVLLRTTREWLSQHAPQLMEKVD